MKRTTFALAALTCAGLALAQPAPSPDAAPAPADTICNVTPPEPLLAWQGEAAYRARASVRDGRVTRLDIRALTPGVEAWAQRAMIKSVNEAVRQAQCSGSHEIEQQFIFGQPRGGVTMTPAVATTATTAPAAWPPERCGTAWTGGCVDGLADGDGRLEAVDEQGQLRYRHEGPLRAGRRDGAGVTTRADGSRVEGSFTNDRLEGLGRIVFANGDVYDGDWQGGLAAGQGRLKFTRGDAYTGRLQAGQLDAGQYRWANGASYNGSFTNNRLNGPGELRFADGATLTARFANGVPHGPVKLRLPEGGSYEGEFERGLLKTSRDDVLTAGYLRLQRLRMPVVAAMGPLSDSRSVVLACSGSVRFSVTDFGWKGRAVYHATVDVKAGVVQAVTVKPTQSSGDTGVDKRYVEALEQTIKARTQCTGDARIERSYAVEMR